MKFNEVQISKALNDTSIDLGDYVINPFMGCEFSCLYCYVRSNRSVLKRREVWGEYVDVRTNLPDMLESEIQRKKPAKVLLGSTTECFQPAEAKYKIMGRVLEILNKNGVRYNILTRSPAILDHLPLLKAGSCDMVYFTVNRFSDKFKSALEPKSPSFGLRDEAVLRLLDEGIRVTPYMSPLLPWVSDMRDVFARYPKADGVEFECLNFNLPNIRQIVDAISSVDSSLREKYEEMIADKGNYDRVWAYAKKEIEKQAIGAKKRYNIYVHKFGGYFENKYSK